MIDIHSHILYGVDDGPSSMEESLKMVSEAAKRCIKTIIATPHLKKYDLDNKVFENYVKLENHAKSLGIKILLGYEILINPSLPGIISENNFLTLNNSRYLLLELPSDTIPIYIYEVIFQLQLKQITVIIAHPERNRNLLQNMDTLIGLVERECLIQLDAASIIGVYGRKVKEFTKKLIKLKLAHFISSDAHNVTGYSTWFPRAYKTVKRWSGQEYTDKLFKNNAVSIVYNVKESVYEMI